jgi:UDP-2,3-diacylglucosamine hydrolase
MKQALFISDLHLSPERPGIKRLFFDFLRETAGEASALYILGDLFEYWAGDDDLHSAFNAEVASALKELSDGRVAVYLMHGNRDFLIGEEFVRACGARLLPDPTLIDLYGTPTLLMHGDTLCTDDIAYQAFRRQVRNPDWQKGFLAQPLSVRKAAIEKLRVQNEQEKGGKSMEIMDVTPEAVVSVLRQYNVPRLIHGHTHRPALHLHDVDGKICKRFVLCDWYERGAYLRCAAEGCAAFDLDSKQ